MSYIDKYFSGKGPSSLPRSKKPRGFKSLTTRVVGRLTVNMRRSRSSRTRDERWCTCECGAGSYLTWKEVSRRRKADVGCCKPDCSISILPNKECKSQQARIRKLLLDLLQEQPEMVDPEWGGTAYEGIVPVSKAEAIMAIQAEYPAWKAGPDRKWWNLMRKNPYLPYSAANCWLGVKDKPYLKTDMMGESISVKELAGMYRLSITRTTELVYLYQGSDLVNKLIEEGVTCHTTLAE